MMAHQQLDDTARLSLSVEDDNNPARTLYEQLGFTVHHAAGGSRTMVRTLTDHPTPRPVAGAGRRPASETEASP